MSQEYKTCHLLPGGNHSLDLFAVGLNEPYLDSCKTSGIISSIISQTFSVKFLGFEASLLHYLHSLELRSALHSIFCFQRSLKFLLYPIFIYCSGCFTVWFLNFGLAVTNKTINRALNNKFREPREEGNQLHRKDEVELAMFLVPLYSYLLGAFPLFVSLVSQLWSTRCQILVQYWAVH